MTNPFERGARTKAHALTFLYKGPFSGESSPEIDMRSLSVPISVSSSPFSSPFPAIPLISQSREAPPFDEVVTFATFQGDETTNASGHYLFLHN